MYEMPSGDLHSMLIFVPKLCVQCTGLPTCLKSIQFIVEMFY